MANFGNFLGVSFIEGLGESPYKDFSSLGETISKFESMHDVVLPPIVRSYFLSIDPSDDGYYDENLMRFWPIGEVDTKGADIKAQPPHPYRARHLFEFADFCLYCWSYAVFLNDDPNQPAPVFKIEGLELGQTNIVADSFDDFLQMHIDDPASIL